LYNRQNPVSLGVECRLMAKCHAAVLVLLLYRIDQCNSVIITYQSNSSFNHIASLLYVCSGVSGVFKVPVLILSFLLL